MNDYAGASAASSAPDSFPPAAAGAAGDSPVASADSPAAVRLSPYYWIFAVSGFAALIYESVWARYIKTFLGNDAAAQVFILAVFLVSLASGAAVCAKFSEQLQRPLLWVAAIQVLVALNAVYFYDIFIAAQRAAFSVLPALESGFSVNVFKFVFAAFLIAPQTILLGATFPLMCAGLTRLRPESSGQVLSLLYFILALSGAAGILVGGFLLVPQFGLPGTGTAAGLLSAAAGAAVWFLCRRQEHGDAPLVAAAAAAPAGVDKRNLQKIILAAAFFTGFALLIYETVWVRMLSLLLVPATEMLDLMLAAFLFSLAIGALAARRIAAAAAESLFILAILQIALGVLAVATLFAFPLFVDILRDALGEIRRDENGYFIYNLLAAGLSLAMFLPAACAGMCAPLFTRRLLSASGEAASGRVFAAGLLGAACGAAAATLWFLPALGIQFSLLLAGAVISMDIGVLLLFFTATRRPRRLQTAGAVATFAVLVPALVFANINPQLAAAGVFYQPQAALPSVIFHQNGQNAYVAITERIAQNDMRELSLVNNGTRIAALFADEMNGETLFAADEIAMVMSGLLPLLLRPDAQTALNIGFGAGLTSRTLLLSPALRQLDNVETEPAIVDAALFLGARVAPVFADSRNRFIFDGANTFPTRGGKYGIIVSTPPHSWNGGAGFYTKQFYTRVRHALAKNGVFAQRLSLRGLTPQLAASIAHAMADVFGDFHVYLMGRGSLLFVAAAETLPPLRSDIFSAPEAKRFLSAYRFSSVADAASVFLGDRKLLMPYFLSFQTPANDAHDPYLENNAFRAAFLQSDFSYFGKIPLLPPPLLEMLGGRAYSTTGVTAQPYSPLRQKAAQARIFYEERHNPNGDMQKTLADLAATPCPADADVNTGYLEKISSAISLLMPVTETEKMAEIWAMLETDNCMTRLLAQNDTVGGVYMQFWRALSLRDAPLIIAATNALLPHAELDKPSGQILLLAAAAANFQQKEYQRAVLLLLEIPQINPLTAAAARWIGASAAEKL